MKSLKILAASAVATVGFATASTPAMAYQDPLLGQLMPVGFNFCPRGWATAAGQILPINQNQSLYSLFGTTYGGDGRTSFGLPDLRGRSALGDGQLSGGSNYPLGRKAGAESFTVTTANMPSHTHDGRIKATNAAGNSTTPVRNSLAISPTGTNIYSTADPANNMNANDLNISVTGGGQAVNKSSPSLAIQWCVALQGVFPSRN